MHQEIIKYLNELYEKVDWVSWRKICCSKECGGLGVKDISFLMTSYLQNRGGEFIITHSC